MTVAPTVIGIDIGTSQAKGGIFDATGKCLGKETARYSISSPYPHWAETDPEEWWRAVKYIIRRSIHKTKVSPDNIRAISISSLVPCCVPINKKGIPLRKAILWLDRRTGDECKWIEEKIGTKKCMELSGNRVAHYYWGPKVLWFKNKEPDLFKETWKLLQAHSYLTYKLTGNTVTDFSCGGLSMPLYDYRKATWSEWGCEKLGIPMEMLPELRQSSEVIGEVSRIAAQETGLKRGTLVVTGCGDFAASTLGAGVTEEGEACVMLGTAGNLLIPMERPKFDLRMINSSHAIKKRYISFGTSYAGGSLQWFLRLIGKAQPDESPINQKLSYQTLDEEASFITLGSGGLIFLPYLMGELTLHWNPNACGVFFGLSTAHTQAHLYRSILEAIGYRLYMAVKIAKNQGIEIKKATIVNGGGKSQLWRQIISDIMGIPLYYTESEGAPLGNAILAALGCGLIKGGREIKKQLKIKAKNEPDIGNHKRYNEYFNLYKNIYDHLREDFESRCIIHLSY